MVRFLVLALAVPWVALAEVLTQDLPIYKRPTEDQKPVITLPEGHTVRLGEFEGEFRRVRFQWREKKRSGYARLSDLGRALKATKEERHWSIGFGVNYGDWLQKSKTITTTDQVQYITNEFGGRAIGVAGVIQVFEVNPWRLRGGYKVLSFTSEASRNTLPGTLEIDVDYGLLFGSLEKVWTLGRWFYLGGGGEMAKAISVSAKLGGQELEVSDKPLFLSVFGVGGMQFNISKRWTALLDSRLAVVANQSPTIRIFEGGVYFIRWF